MRVEGVHYRTIWHEGLTVRTIDQARLPHRFETMDLTSLSDAIHAIKNMHVRGAPLIGATAAYGVALAMVEDPSDSHLAKARARLLEARPTAVNLRWALDIMVDRLQALHPEQRQEAAFRSAAEICDEDAAICRAIGDHGFALFQEHYETTGRPVNILTHCNAGWLATLDWGTALAPVYIAHDNRIPVHVWVDETRPRNQGASLTAWELKSHGVPHTVIVDNAGGHLMQKGRVDMVITGTDRTTANGDVCNKIGTYLKALAAHDNDIPFYVALPSPTVDWTLNSGADVPIEERDGDEVCRVTGRDATGAVTSVMVTPENTAAENPAFDITPARLITGFITERGITEASASGLARLFPGQANGD